MAKNVLLDNVTHQNLKIIPERGPHLGDAIGYSAIVPWEFRQVAASYPIFFRKTSNNQFEVVALFGFSSDENLFVDAQGWGDNYIPLSVERMPFSIGYTQDMETGQRQPDRKSVV